MRDRYKIILVNDLFYKEIELSVDEAEYRIGTTNNCNVIFSKELFQNDFELSIVFEDDKLIIQCDDSIYVRKDLKRLNSVEIKVNEQNDILYVNDEKLVFHIRMIYDLSFTSDHFNLAISLEDLGRINIGNSNEDDIFINTKNDRSYRIIIYKDIRGFVIKSGQVYDDVYVNGIPIDTEIILEDFDIIKVAEYIFLLRDEYLFTQYSDSLRFQNLVYFDISKQNNQLKYPKYNRSTRIKYKLPDEEINILPPERKPSIPTQHLIASIIPALAMILLTVVIRGFLAGGSIFIVYSIGINVVGISMSVYTYRKNKKKYVDSIEERERKYSEYIAEKEDKIHDVLNREYMLRNLIDKSPIDNINLVYDFDRRLFEKSIDDADFLNIYLGLGDCRAHYNIKINDKDEICLDDELQEYPERIKETYKNIENVPITVNIYEKAVLGIIGSWDRMYEMIKNISINIVVTHFYRDVKIFYILPPEDCERFCWVKWLKNVYDEDLDIRNISCDDESSAIILEYLYNIFAERETAANDERKCTFFPHIVVFVYDMREFVKHPVAKYIKDSVRLGFSLIFFSEYLETLPNRCDNIIELNDFSNEARIIDVEDGSSERKFTYEVVSDEDIWNTSVRLSAVFVDDVKLESTLPNQISLFDILKVNKVNDLNLSYRWRMAKVYESMAAPIGVKRKNELVYLDISDNPRAHGPHGLVAGTTGSGKSEILQTYILSMATLFHPYDVSFVIIDFKGGGMTNQFRKLPHLMGAITNIDGHEIDRSLRSIKAELIKRQELFSKNNVNHINDYVKLFKEGKVELPLPHLIMIVDEFAELKAEYPEFMKEIISTARIGRTLGIHLILATQKPTGVVDNQIWSNSKFKLCLKVQTKADSNEILKTPLAAEIIEPGRAYFQVGNNEVSNIFDKTSKCKCIGECIKSISNKE